jgi:tRNA A37 methylthiotransferase MiaB
LVVTDLIKSLLGAVTQRQTTQDFSSRRQETLKKLPANQKWKLLTQYKGSTLEMLVRGSHWFITRAT